VPRKIWQPWPPGIASGYRAGKKRLFFHAGKKKQKFKSWPLSSDKSNLISFLSEGRKKEKKLKSNSTYVGETKKTKHFRNDLNCAHVYTYVHTLLTRWPKKNTFFEINDLQR
jgi:hypothetical protein